MIDLVIKIPDEIRKSIFDGVYCGIIDKRVSDAIRDGVPLPEGHRGIVDLKEVKWAFDDAIMKEAERTGNVRATSDEIAEVLITVPVLIPADRSGE